MKYRLNKDTELTTTIIKKLIEQHSTEIARMDKLEQYYLTQNDICYRTIEDSSKPNNRIANAYASYISDTLTGYFIGEPVTYNSNDKALLEQIQNILIYNDEADENAELSKDMSIFGVAYEMLYLDTDGQIRFKRVEPREVIFVHDNTFEDELLYVIRHYICNDIVTDEQYQIVEVYSRNNIVIYKTSVNVDNLIQIDEPIQNYFKLVPFIEFKNNEYCIGDFEPVISLIDAYDKLESDSVNDAEYFTNAYLCLIGLNAESEDIAKMKENRVILLDQDGSDAKWLTKDLTNSGTETLKNKLDADIHKFTKCPNMSDENFANNTSGVAIKFKLLGTENLISIKERKFKKGLQRRLELISYIQDLYDSAFDYRDIEIIFTRNLPANDTEIADVINKLSTIVSKETLLSQIPFVTDVQSELEKLEVEKESNAFYDYPLPEIEEKEDITTTEETNKVGE